MFNKDNIITLCAVVIPALIVGLQIKNYQVDNNTIPLTTSRDTFRNVSHVAYYSNLVSTVDLNNKQIRVFDNVNNADNVYKASDSLMDISVKEIELNDKPANVIKKWVDDSSTLLKEKKVGDLPLGIQTFQQYNNNRYTGIVKYNKMVNNRPSPIIYIYQIIDTGDGFIQVYCTNQKMETFDRDLLLNDLAELCSSLELTCGAIDLVTMYGIEDGSLENAAFRGDASVYTEGKYFVFDEKTGTILEYSSGLLNAPKRVVIPSEINGVSVKRIGERAFYRSNSNNGVTYVYIPDSVEYIDDEAFLACVDMSSIRLPDNLKGIGTSAFQGCTALKELELVGNVYEISDNAFKNCTSLEKIALTNSVTIIKASAFENDRNLNEITDIDGVKIIESRAFSNTGISKDLFSNNVNIDIDSLAFD